MLKFQITTKNDLKEAAVIERRRKYEEERKKRIFNARHRLFGLDYDTLEKQISEKRKQEHEQAEIDKKYLEETKRRADIIRQKDEELEKERRCMEADINFYRCRFQRKEDRREFDLNDPEFHRKSKPARSSDKDPRLGISSAQIFAGEDLMSADRMKQQKDQQRAWLEQQIRERKQADTDRLKADKKIQKSLEVRDKQAVEFASAEMNNRARTQAAIAEYNKQLALEQDAKKKLAKQHEQEDNLAEIYNLLTSDMLTENPDVAQSRLAPNKKVAYLYRGMTPEELEHFRHGQQMQKQENCKRKNDEALVNAQWEQFSKNISRTVTLKQIEMEREAKKRFDELMKENSELANEQKTRQEFVNKVLYTNKASPEFFDQFNKTSR